MSQRRSMPITSADAAKLARRFQASGKTLVFRRANGEFVPDQSEGDRWIAARAEALLAASPSIRDFLLRCSQSEAPVPSELPWTDLPAGRERLLAVRGARGGPERVAVEIKGFVHPRSSKIRLALLNALAREAASARSGTAFAEKVGALTETWSGCQRCELRRARGTEVAGTAMPEGSNGVAVREAPLTADGSLLGWLRILGARKDRMAHLTPGFLQAIGAVVGRAFARFDGEQAWDITAQARRNQELQASIQELDMRLRELRCLYQLAALISDPTVLTDEVLARTVSLVPAAYRFPQIAEVRIQAGGRIFESDGFSETPWEQTSVIGTFSSTHGTIQVCYREQRPEAEEGPFSEGERDLIEMVGQLLGDFLERRTTLESLRSTTALLERMVASSSYGIAFMDSSFCYSKVNEAFARMGGYDASSYPGRNHFELFPDVGDEEVFRTVLRTGTPFVAFDQPRTDGTGTTFWDLEVLPVAERGDARDGGSRAAAGQPGGQLVLILVNRTRGKQARLALERSREELRSLASHLQALREEERTRVAREVHDELGGLLTTLKMELSLVARRAARGSCQEEYGSALQLIEQSLAMIHRIATDLRPVVLDDFGLFPALEWHLRDFQKRTGIACDLRADPVEWTLDRASAASLFRIVQEALTNVARHARASAVSVNLHREDRRLCVSVRDNGIGIGPSHLENPRSYGLIGIRERVLSLGGELIVQGTPGAGTTLSLCIPDGNGGTP